MSRTSWWILLIGLSLLLAPGPGPVAASDATEAYLTVDVTMPVKPDPFYCQIAPHAATVPTAAAAGSPGFMAESGAGDPPPPALADAVTTQRIAHAIYGLYACANAHDASRVAAFWADEFVARQTVRSASADVLAALTAGSAGPVTLLTLDDVRVWPDGRVSWRLTLAGADGTPHALAGTMRFEAGRYRLAALAPVALAETQPAASARVTAQPVPAR